MLSVNDDGAPLVDPVFKTVMDVRWGDLDADGHVNNTTVLRYAEEARMRWVEQLGLARSAPQLMPVVASVACAYRAPIGYPMRLSVAVSCARLGSSSLTLAFGIRAHDDPLTSPADLLAEVTNVWVWIDVQSKRPSPMPMALRQAVENVLRASHVNV